MASWFSRSFSMTAGERGREGVSGEESEDEEGEEEEEETDHDELDLAAMGAGVKEDLSNLTKTFTRQLWGVASFLAPPPPAKSSSAAAESSIGSDEEVRASSNVVEIGGSQRGGGAFSEIVGHEESNSAAVQGTFWDTSTDKSDVRDVVSSQNAGDENALPTTSRRPDRPRLTGLRSDFEELRGSVTTGFSRISSVIRVVAGDDSSGGDEDKLLAESPLDIIHLPSTSVGDDRQVDFPRRRINSFLKPVFGNVLTRERRPGEAGSKEDVFSKEDEGAGKDVDAPMSHGEGEFNYIASGIVGFSRFASSVLHMVQDDDGQDKEDEVEYQVEAVGVTDTVISFAREIAMRPETWLDFPLTEDEAEDEFELTNYQKEHGHAVEMAAPGLAALKIELCPNYMTEECFWKIYFVLVHSRLNSDEARLLSTPQVVRVCKSMTLELQKIKPDADGLNEDRNQDLIIKNVQIDKMNPSQLGRKREEEDSASILALTPTDSAATMNDTTSAYFEDTQRASESGEASQTTAVSRVKAEAGQPKSESVKGRIAKLNLEEDETEVDKWLHEEPSIKQQVVGAEHTNLDMSNMAEDVSFSDLEEDDPSQEASGNIEAIESPKTKISDNACLSGAATTSLVVEGGSSYSRHRDRIHSKSSERGEFNDWLTVDQDDVASAGSSSP